jgi:hypothetical protein
MFSSLPASADPGNDRTGNAEIASFTATVSRGQDPATVIYEYKGAPPQKNIALMDGETIDFEFKWRTTPSSIDAPGLTFDNGDFITIPILETNGASVFGNSKKLDLNILDLEMDAEVKVAEGEFSVNNIGDGKKQLVFTITFNDNAENYQDMYGPATGSATITADAGKGGIQLKFYGSAIYSYYPISDPGDLVPGGNPPYVAPPQVPFSPEPPQPRPDALDALSKSISSETAQTGSFVGNNKNIFTALPDRGDKRFPAFQWRAPFFGLQESFEDHPDAPSPSDYVIFEDTVSANTEFSNFVQNGSMGDNSPLYGESSNPAGVINTTYGRETDGNQSANDFFALEIPIKVFHRNLRVGGDNSIGQLNPIDPNSYSSQIYATQSEFLYIVKDADYTAESVKYSSKTAKLSELGTNYGNVSDAVKGTPLSYGIIRNANGTKTLIVNAGRFGKNASAGEGIETENLFFGASPPSRGAQNETAASLIKQAVAVQEAVVGFEDGDVAKKEIEDLIDMLDKDLKAYSPTLTGDGGDGDGRYIYFFGEDKGFENEEAYTIYYQTVMLYDWPDMKKDLELLLENDSEWGEDHSIYWTYMYHDPPKYLFLSNFITSITDYHEVDYDPNVPARYTIAVNTMRIAAALDTFALNYGDRDRSKLKAYRDDFMKSALFYFPQTRGILESELHIEAGKSDGELIRAIFGDDTLNPTDYKVRWDSLQNMDWASIFNNKLTDLSVSSAVLKYRTIMTDTADPLIKNDLTVTVGGDDSTAGSNYIYRYSAGIYGSRKNGGAAFVKADAAKNGRAANAANFEELEDVNALNATFGRLAGAVFGVYSDPDATTQLKFTRGEGEDQNTYTKNDSGGVTQIISPDGGIFRLEGLTVGTTYYIKELAAPEGYISNDAVYPFTATAARTGTEPKYYAIYDAPVPVENEEDEENKEDEGNKGDEENKEDEEKKENEENKGDEENGGNGGGGGYTPPTVTPSENTPSQTPPAEQGAEEPEETPAPAPTPPNASGNTLIPNDDGTFTELDENGVPLGTWRYDEDSGDWIFEPAENPLSELPQTGGVAHSSPYPLLLSAVLLMCAMRIASRLGRKIAESKARRY